MNRSRSCRRIGAGLALCALGLMAACPAAWSARARKGSAASDSSRARASEPEVLAIDARFRLAARQKREGSTDGRARALATYGSILRDAPEHPRACEAAFRSGEIARASGRFDESCRSFAEAEMLDPVGVFGWRAHLERAHIARRSGRAEDALRLYADVFGDVRCKTRYRDEAAFWAGRTQAERGRSIDARAWFRWVCEHAEDPARRVRAYDEWMLGFVAEGDLEAAAGVLAQLRVRIAERLRESTDSGERTRRAFASMRAPKKLEEAVRTRHRTR